MGIRKANSSFQGEFTEVFEDSEKFGAGSDSTPPTAVNPSTFYISHRDII